MLGKLSLFSPRTQFCNTKYKKTKIVFFFSKLPSVSILFQTSKQAADIPKIATLPSSSFSFSLQLVTLAPLF